VYWFHYLIYQPSDRGIQLAGMNSFSFSGRIRNSHDCDRFSACPLGIFDWYLWVSGLSEPGSDFAVLGVGCSVSAVLVRELHVVVDADVQSRPTLCHRLPL